jgi:hypothetical protein
MTKCDKKIGKGDANDNVAPDTPAGVINFEGASSRARITLGGGGQGQGSSDIAFRQPFTLGSPLLTSLLSVGAGYTKRGQPEAR